MKKLNKKGLQLSSIPSIVILLITVALVIGIGSEITNNIRVNSCREYNATGDTCIGATGYAFNASLEGQKGLTNVANWQDTIGLVIAAAAVIGVVIGIFKFNKGF